MNEVIIQKGLEWEIGRREEEQLSEQEALAAEVDKQNWVDTQQEE